MVHAGKSGRGAKRDSKPKSSSKSDSEYTDYFDTDENFPDMYRGIKEVRVHEQNCKEGHDLNLGDFFFDLLFVGFFRSFESYFDNSKRIYTFEEYVIHFLFIWEFWRAQSQYLVVFGENDIFQSGYQFVLGIAIVFSCNFWELGIYTDHEVEQMTLVEYEIASTNLLVTSIFMICANSVLVVVYFRAYAGLFDMINKTPINNFNDSDPSIIKITKEIEEKQDGYRFFIAIRREVLYHSFQILIWLIVCIFSRVPQFASESVILRCMYWLGTMVVIFMRFFERLCSNSDLYFHPSIAQTVDSYHCIFMVALAEVSLILFLRLDRAHGLGVGEYFLSITFSLVLIILIKIFYFDTHFGTTTEVLERGPMYLSGFQILSGFQVLGIVTISLGMHGLHAEVKCYISDFLYHDNINSDKTFTENEVQILCVGCVIFLIATVFLEIMKRIEYTPDIQERYLTWTDYIELTEELHLRWDIPGILLLVLMIIFIVLCLCLPYIPGIASKTWIIFVTTSAMFLMLILPDTLGYQVSARLGEKHLNISESTFQSSEDLDLNLPTPVKTDDPVLHQSTSPQTNETSFEHVHHVSSTHDFTSLVLRDSIAYD